jgi:outer membrane biogenesis lipoprotein LolB
MNSIRSIYKRRLTTPKAACNRKVAITCLLIAAVFFSCATHKAKIALPAYNDFISVRQQSIPQAVLEMYGRYAASLSGKTARSTFNLLLDPGKNAYIEILNPASRMTHAVSLNGDQVSLLWAQESNYVEEKASAQTLNEIAGIPVMPDDLLFLIAGYGLNFTSWKMDATNQDGWTLSRDSFEAKLTMRENLSKIEISSNNGPRLRVSYDEYKQVDNRSLPARIRFEVPDRKLQIELQIDKYVPRDEPATSDLFALKIPESAHRLSLNQIYHGKPLLLQ